MTEGDLDPGQKKLWLKALSAIEMNNLDYAVSLLQNIVKEEPGFLQGRKTMRAAAVQAQKGAGKKGAMMKPWGKLKGKVKKDPVGALSEIDMDTLSAPPDAGDLRPIREQDVEESDPDSHWLPFVVIE